MSAAAVLLLTCCTTANSTSSEVLKDEQEQDQDQVVTRSAFSTYVTMHILCTGTMRSWHDVHTSRWKRVDDEIDTADEPEQDTYNTSWARRCSSSVLAHYGLQLDGFVRPMCRRRRVVPVPVIRYHGKQAGIRRIVSDKVQGGEQQLATETIIIYILTTIEQPSLLAQKSRTTWDRGGCMFLALRHGTRPLISRNDLRGPGHHWAVT
jgi:hypothetical protein